MQTRGAGHYETDASSILNLAQRFERLPFTGYQQKIFAIIATAWLFDSIDLASLTFVLAPISEEFGWGHHSRYAGRPIRSQSGLPEQHDPLGFG